LDDVFTPDEVAGILKIPKSTLYSWRYHRSGPKAIRVGRHLRYRRRDLEAYLDGLEERGATAGTVIAAPER
jgi:excisionase family DNA binding protein